MFFDEPVSLVKVAIIQGDKILLPCKVNFQIDNAP